MSWNVITTLLGPETSESIRKACEIAWCREVAAVRVQTKWVKPCLEHLNGKAVRVSALVGLPYGASSLPALLTEVQHAIIQGAHEIALMLDMGALKEGDLDRVAMIIREVRYQLRERPLSVVLDVDTLTSEQLSASYGLLRELRLPAIEICTSQRKEIGIEDVRALRKLFPSDVTRVGVIGDIRKTDLAEALYKAGASDIVTPMGFELAYALSEEHADRTAVFSRQQGTAGG